MFRLLLRVALATAIVLGTVQPVKGSGSGPCSQDRFDVKPRMGHEKVERKVRALIRCAVNRWDVPGGVSKALDVAKCESGFWPWAVGGDNLGVFQHKDDYWVDRVDRWLRESWFNKQQWERLHTIPQGAFLARANVLVAIRMAHTGGWGPWACA